MNVGFDNDGMFDYGAPETDGPDFLARLVDWYADAGARFLAFGVGGCFAWTFTPTVMEAPWVADPAFAAVHWNQLRAFRAAGTDPLAIVLKRARERGLPLHANFRFNRYLPAFSPPLTSSWFSAHPEYRLSRNSCPFWADDAPEPRREQWSVNLAIPDVRETLVRELLDVAERYPVDALQLEVQRAVPFFETDEPRKKEHFNEFVWLLRSGLDRIRRAQRRNVALAFWLPTEGHHRVLRGMWPDRFIGDDVWGLDPATWIREGLVDLLIVSAFAADLGMAEPVPVPAWVRLAKGTRTRIYGCCMNYGWLKPEERTPERCAPLARVIATVHSQYGGVFLFNTTPLDIAEILAIGCGAPDDPERLP